MGTRLPDKILALAEGEWFILPDENRSMDRALVTLKRRSPRLSGVDFTVTRVRYVEGDRLRPGVKITMARKG